MRLLEINFRDEAARHEPMHAGENAAAYRRIPTIAWSNYPYTVALVPGAGLSDQMERENHALSPMGRQIIEIAARRYHDRKVAIIIVSGGYVHPKHSRFAEAIEMKRALMRDFGVPEDAILVDPHARHTTTNVRNAARLVFRYGIPAERPALITTQQYHLDSIASAAFDERNERELGYRPYVSTRRLSRFEVEWLPNVMSLHADPLDPLDP
ncbi:MAG: YdcF family protein [Acidobacteria bacterium]|nr:YdcF family protein [Acidobacteriota bacterium]